MKKFTLHEVWEIMRDTSAHTAGDDDYAEAAEAHFNVINDLTEEDAAEFRAQVDVIKVLLQNLMDQLTVLVEKTCEEAGIPTNPVKWGSQEVLSYIAAAQTKGVFTEILVVGILSQQNLPLLFDFIEPEEVQEEEAVDGN